MLLRQLLDKKLLKECPCWLPDNCAYLTISGSIAYGCSDTNADGASDFDVIGICTPLKDMIFPHLAGHIHCFDDPPKQQPGNGSGVYEEHHVYDPDARGGKGRNYDLNIYSIIKFFHECKKCNPNLIDSLFTSHECILHCTQVGNIIRENRKMFLSKKCWNTYKQYAYSQLHKMKSKNPIGKRKEEREKYGFDLKFSYNLVRLLEECNQILATGDLDLMANREQLKSIRRGEWTREDVEKYFQNKEKILENLYAQSNLPMQVDEIKIKQVLLQCLEHHYGNISKCVTIPDKDNILIRQIKNLITNAGY